MFRAGSRSSMVVALLIILGFIVLIMFAIWLSTRVKYKVVVPVTIVDDLGGGGSAMALPEARRSWRR